MVKKKIFFMAETMGGSVFTCIVELLSELVDSSEICIANVTRVQTVRACKKYRGEQIYLINGKRLTQFINPSIYLDSIRETLNGHTITALFKNIIINFIRIYCKWSDCSTVGEAVV